jgi:hypothetical protein
MPEPICLLAEANDDESINAWLDQNPAILGSIALLLATGLVLTGIANLKTGVTYNKFGVKSQGDTAHLSGWVRIIAGIGCAAFGLYIFAG